MDIFKACFLGILQGLTEFLPVSSSGHLVLFQKIFHLNEAPIFFDTMVHFGTFFSLLFYFRKSLKEIFKKDYLWRLFLGSLPIVIFGFLMRNKIEEIFDSLFLTGISFFITSFLLFLTLFFREKKEEISFFDAFFIGVFQALALLPGVSRSGTTLSAGNFLSISYKKNFKFSFHLGMIAIFGAVILQTMNIHKVSNEEVKMSFLGFIFAFLSGIFALNFLAKIFFKRKLYLFSFYTFLLGIFCLIYYFL